MGVGAEENKQGFGLGKALKDAKPTANVDALIRDDASEQDIPTDLPQKKDLDQQPVSEQINRKMESIDRNQVNIR